MKKFLFILTILTLFSTTSSYGLMSAKKIDDCAQIVLKSGDIIQANIIQITPTEIKYKRCGKPNDPEISISKKEVLSIKASDGDIIYRNSNKSANNDVDDSEKKFSGLAIAGFVLSLFWWFYGIGAVLGLIFCAIALAKINRNPEKYRGKGLAIAGLVISLVALGLIILLIIGG